MSSNSDDEVPTINDEHVLNKYKMAAEIVNLILKELIGMVQPGISTLELCSTGDMRIEEETGKIFKREKNMKKGIAFPTCVSVNNIIEYYCPLKSDPNITVLKEGDVVKINLGAHVDGFPVVVGHTVVCSDDPGVVVKGRKADVILAAHAVSEACIRLLRPNKENNYLSQMGSRFAEEYGCKLIEGIQCHQMEKDNYMVGKTVVWNPTEEQRKVTEKCEFCVYEVWNVNVVVSTGDGKPRLHDSRATVFKKNDTVYQLKMKASRQFFRELANRFQSFPFSLRAFEDECRARMGVKECVSHDLLEPLEVHQEKEGEIVAQFQYTLLLMRGGNLKITGLPLDKNQFQSDYSVANQELKDILAMSVAKKATKKKKKKKDESDVAAVTSEVVTNSAGLIPECVFPD